MVLVLLTASLMTGRTHVENGRTARDPAVFARKARLRRRHVFVHLPLNGARVGLLLPWAAMLIVVISVIRIPVTIVTPVIGIVRVALSAVLDV